MKHVLISLIVLLFINFNLKAQEDLSPYIKVGESDKSMEQVTKDVIQTLKENSFSVLGAYHPSNKSSLTVVIFTRNDLKNAVIKVVDRGALAATMKVGLVQKDGKIIISYTNPDYLLRAYLMNNYNTFRGTFIKFSDDLKSTFSSLGKEFIPFGGTVRSDKLKKYHYKVLMPYFTDPVELREFASFEEGLETITKNLEAKKGNAVKVYKLVYKSQKVAVFGIGLHDKEEGEPNFLPKIGEDHAAALPYEIILQGKEATMLHGKYRIALHWPDLTMGTFMKIMSTPGDIEDALEALCE